MSPTAKDLRLSAMYVAAQRDDAIPGADVRWLFEEYRLLRLRLAETERVQGILDSQLTLLLASCRDVLGASHPIATPAGGEEWRLMADRTEIGHLVRWLDAFLAKGQSVHVYGLTELSAEERSQGGTEVCGIAQWAADEIDDVRSALLVVPR